MKKIFRQKYQYNPDKPVFSSENVKTYNCMNTQTGNKRLIIIEHLVPPTFVQPSPGILQPIQIPTTAQPFSIYPITFCISQVTKLSEPDAMYIIKCLTQCKLKKPLYCVLSDQGVCCSQVEGVLPQKSPPIIKIVQDLLGLQDNFEPKQNCVISRQGLDLAKSIKNGENVAGRFLQYGWKDPKSAKQVITDEQFLIFKGRRKQQGIFDSEYGLAWHNKEHGMCRFRYISLAKNGFEQYFYRQFNELINYTQSSQKPYPFLRNLKLFKDSKGIKIFTQLPNQGTLSQFINNKSQLGQPLTEKNTVTMLTNFVQSMAKFSSEFKNQGLGTLHIKSFFVHNNRLCLGDPLLVTDTVQQKLRTSKKTLDYFAPQLKQTIIDQKSYLNLSKEKMDIWSFGFILHKIFTKQLPVFDSSKKPNLNKSKLSVAMNQLVTKCLDEYPINRPSWKDMNFKQIQKRSVMIQQIKQQQSKRQQIKLGTKTQKRSQKPKSPQKKHRVIQQLNQQQQKNRQRQSQQANLKQKEQQVDQKMPIPQQISTKLRRIKLVTKTIIILSIYIFVFFRVFLWSSAQIIQVRSNYATTSLNLVDNQGSKISTTTIITSNPMYFMTNSVSFDQIQNTYQCIDQNFNPIYEPNYSLLDYIQSGGFLALLITGWITMGIICVIKGISMWKGGVSNRPDKSQTRHWITYAFHELTLAALLFAHFYIYEFFYFAGATPCLSIANFKGLQAFFDSSLYLFLSNTQSYFQQVFSTLGILSIILLLSTCFYAWGPKLDQKYISSIPSILLRVVPFVLFLLICRIGVFWLFAPTAINDSTKLIPTIIQNSFQGFIGMIPQVFVVICVTIQVLIQIFWYWCEKKTAQSDRLARFFNIKKKKATIDNDVSRIDKSVSNLDNSKMKLQSSSNDLY